MTNDLPKWLKKDSSYTGNNNGFNTLYNALHTQYNPDCLPIICFAGAGCSMPLLEGWKDLLVSLQRMMLEESRIAAYREMLKNMGDPDSYMGGYLKYAEDLKQNQNDNFFSILRKRLTVAKDKPSFTRIHAAIACMKVRGVVTTNFDTLLDRARLGRWLLAGSRDDLDKSVCVGLESSKAAEKIETWSKIDDRTFKYGGHTNAPLYLHGSIDTIESIVLTLSDFNKFYKPGKKLHPGAYFLDRLTSSASFLFIGYSFNDPFLNYLISSVAKHKEWRGAHYAIIGVNEGFPTEELDEKTKVLLNMKITPVYYPITSGDLEHSNLHVLLDRLDFYDPKLVNELYERAKPPVHANPPIEKQIQTKPVEVEAILTRNRNEWAKLPDIDSRQYVKREEIITQIENRVCDLRTRVIALVGIGGTGKTTIIRQVLQSDEIAKLRYPDGVLVYPVRDDAHVERMIEALCEHFSPEKQLANLSERLECARSLLSSRRILLVLDGVELLQGRPGQPESGRFLSQELRSLILGLLRAGQSLIVLTSRFPLVELADCGDRENKCVAGAAIIEIDGLTSDESIELLSRQVKNTSEKILRKVHDEFGGHPLSLTLFANAVSTSDAAFASGDVKAALRCFHDKSLDAKLVVLLDWYKKNLLPEQMAVLQQLAVYPGVIFHAEMRALLESKRVLVGTRALSETKGFKALDELKQMQLIQYDEGEGSYECHAVVRQQIRAESSEVANMAMESLTSDAPEDGEVESVAELQRVVDAIEIAIESLGDFWRANRLLISRLDSGRSFIKLGAPQIGIACIGRLVTDEAWTGGNNRRLDAEKALGASTIGTYVNWMREFHCAMGNLAEAERWRLFEGEHYIKFASRLNQTLVNYWDDGNTYAIARGDRSMVLAIREEVWSRYGESLRRAIRAGKLDKEQICASVLKEFVDMVGEYNDKWKSLSCALMRDPFQASDSSLVEVLLSHVADAQRIFKARHFKLPGRVENIQHMKGIDENRLRCSWKRTSKAVSRIHFMRLITSDEMVEVQDLFNMATDAGRSVDGDNNPVVQRLTAEAFLAVSVTFEEKRIFPSAALARSWAAESFILCGEAARGVELASRALDVCSEDRMEQARAYYMLGHARLALGEFQQALKDAEQSCDIARAGGWPFYISGSLALRWLAARELGDKRAVGMEHEYRAYCEKVYRKAYYNALPDLALLPGEAGFAAAYPQLNWPDHQLAVMPDEREILKSIANGEFNQFLQSFRDKK